MTHAIINLLTFAANSNCDYTQVYCRSTGKCLDKSVQCNGKPDCDDWSDEAHCSKYPVPCYWRASDELSWHLYGVFTVYDALNKHGRERNSFRYEPELAKESSSLTSCNFGLLLALKTYGKSNARVVPIHVLPPPSNPFRFRRLWPSHICSWARSNSILSPEVSNDLGLELLCNLLLVYAKQYLKIPVKCMDHLLDIFKYNSVLFNNYTATQSSEFESVCCYLKLTW